MMKKRLVIIICCILLCGCQNTTKQQTDKKEENFSEYDLLVKGYWSHYDPIIGEMENMTLTKKGEFIYCCSCVEPINDSDLYDTYSYEEPGKITLRSSDDQYSEEIDILSIDDMMLLIKMEDDIIEFYNQKKMNNLSGYYEFQTCKKCMECIKDYDGYCIINKIADDIQFLPINHDEQYVKHRLMSNDIQFFYLKSKTVINDSGLINQHDCTYQSLTKKDSIKQAKKETPAFLWYNEQKEITKVVFMIY